MSYYQLLPPLSEQAYNSLKESIADIGVTVPIIVDEHGNIIDGHHRAQICQELGITPPQITLTGLTEQQKRTKSRQLNLQRRHLTTKEKQQVITQELEENPTTPNIIIATQLGVSDTTVAKIRAKLGLTNNIIGKDGKTYKPNKPRQKYTWIKYSLAFRTQNDYEIWMAVTRTIKKRYPGIPIGEAILKFYTDKLNEEN
jgi:ParB/RepB/Spo0J family partition protein